MTIKCSVYCGASLDGYIAGPGGDIEWLNRPEFAPAHATGVTFREFASTVDALVMGRHTFEKLLTFNVWHYAVPVVVVSSTLHRVPEHLEGKARLMDASPTEIVRQLEREGFRHLYVDGGATIQRFLRERLIDDIIVTYLPILLGDGIPLFGTGGIETPLELVAAVTNKNILQVRYRVRTPGRAPGSSTATATPKRALPQKGTRPKTRGKRR